MRVSARAGEGDGEALSASAVVEGAPLAVLVAEAQVVLVVLDLLVLLVLTAQQILAVAVVEVVREHLLHLLLVVQAEAV